MSKKLINIILMNMRNILIFINDLFVRSYSDNLAYEYADNLAYEYADDLAYEDADSLHSSLVFIKRGDHDTDDDSDSERPIKKAKINDSNAENLDPEGSNQTQEYQPEGNSSESEEDFNSNVRENEDSDSSHNGVDPNSNADVDSNVDSETEQLLDELDVVRRAREGDEEAGNLIRERFEEFFDEESGNGRDNQEGYKQVEDMLEEDLNSSTNNFRSMEKMNDNTISDNSEINQDLPVDLESENALIWISLDENLFFLNFIPIIILILTAVYLICLTYNSKNKDF